MKLKLLVSGCSITHGAELYNGFMHEENVKRSYSAYMSRALNTELVNVALSGASNEYIFHSILDSLHNSDGIHSVVVMWTSPNRIHWKSQDRHWFVLPQWVASVANLTNFEMYTRQAYGTRFIGDSEQVIDQLCNIFPFMIQNCFDQQEMTKKTWNYQQAIQAVCCAKQIKLVQLSVNDLVSNHLIPRLKHPTDSEHESIAKFILKKYYENT